MASEGEETVVVNKNKRFRREKRTLCAVSGRAHALKLLNSLGHGRHQPWKIEHFTAADNKAGAFTEESSFATLFPKYREKYLREAWSAVTNALEPHGVACQLDLIHGSMSVRTTRKTFDPYIVLKARDMIKLLARGVAVGQAVKIMEDNTACDIIKIGNLVRNKERFVKRRQRIIGPDGSTLKASNVMYALNVQGNTVSVMGPYKSLKEVRRIVLDCMKNIHPIYRIKELMIKRELSKDPKLAEESWDRFLPQFRRKHLKTSEKTARKNEKNEVKFEARKAAGAEPEQSAQKPAKKVYTPFPPAQQPRKVDLQLESGEYFLKPHEKERREEHEKKQKQLEATAKRRAERAEAFVAPVEEAAPTVEEKRKRKRREAEVDTDAEAVSHKNKVGKKQKKKVTIAEEDPGPRAHVSSTARTPHPTFLSATTDTTHPSAMATNNSAWLPTSGRYQVTIGSSLKKALKASKGAPSAPKRSNLPDKDFYSFRYNFKPESIDPKKSGTIEVNQGQDATSVTVHRPTSKPNEMQEFLGEEKPAKDWECILIYDEELGTYTLEKLDSLISLNYHRPRDALPPIPVSSHPPPPSVGKTTSDLVKMLEGELEEVEEGELEDDPAPVPTIQQLRAKEEEEEEEEEEIPIAAQQLKPPATARPPLPRAKTALPPAPNSTANSLLTSPLPAAPKSHTPAKSKSNSNKRAYAHADVEDFEIKRPSLAKRARTTPPPPVSQTFSLALPSPSGPDPLAHQKVFVAPAPPALPPQPASPSQLDSDDEGGWDEIATPAPATYVPPPSSMQVDEEEVQEFDADAFAAEVDDVLTWDQVEDEEDDENGDGLFPPDVDEAPVASRPISLNAYAGGLAEDDDDDSFSSSDSSDEDD
ncbi:hypothetical protein EW146_g1056 [Bondarzewia mesenterica]|uniref:KRR-R motif-containing protein 1 n=1 Tax=Bondarzewia mesenterica TaxID=1095465 RepID=A0A4S4M4Y0_9AGAM|nr:hypothetical protein EW146_g1056 [Bondarzewia mesenterica]